MRPALLSTLPYVESSDVVLILIVLRPFDVSHCMNPAAKQKQNPPPLLPFLHLRLLRATRGLLLLLGVPLLLRLSPGAV